jgi:hypothetical protein
MEQAVLRGAGGFSEVDFLHKPTRTLILTDLVVNLEAERLTPSMRLFSRLMGVLAPDGMATVYLRLLIKARRAEAEPVARRLLAWHPERVIFSHGRWFESDGTARLSRSLRWLVNEG